MIKVWLNFFKTCLVYWTLFSFWIEKAKNYTIIVEIALAILKYTLNSQAFKLDFLKLWQIILIVNHNVG
jgi:hypothetical protein